MGEFVCGSILKAVSKFRKSKKKIAVHFCKLTSSIKREIRKFHVKDVQSRQRNVSESVMHQQNRYFAQFRLLNGCFLAVVIPVAVA